MTTNYTTKSRKRELRFPGFSKSVFQSGGTKLISASSEPGGGVLVGEQFLGSQGNRRNRNGNYEGGGPFYMSRAEASGGFRTISFVNNEGAGATTKYAGTSIIPYTAMSASKRNALLKYKGTVDSDALNQNGATAISLVAPTNAPSTLGEGLAEAHREGLPALPGVPSWRNRTSVAKAAGSEYLNQVFGWLPLVSEVKEVASAAKNFSNLQYAYEKHAGKDTRREFSFPVESDSYSESLGNAYPIIPGYSMSSFYNISPGTLTVSVSTETKAWFSGAFTYALPSSSDKWQRMLGYGSEADRIFGLRLDPDILWELAPWSWAVDWFSNAGMVINNVSNFALAGLVMRYGYSMLERVETVTLNLSGTKARVRSDTGNIFSDISLDPGPLTFENVLKTRAPANPFGFGLSWDGLSPTQLLIAAAIGITRL